MKSRRSAVFSPCHTWRLVYCRQQHKLPVLHPPAAGTGRRYQDKRLMGTKKGFLFWVPDHCLGGKPAKSSETYLSHWWYSFDVFSPWASFWLKRSQGFPAAAFASHKEIWRKTKCEGVAPLWCLQRASISGMNYEETGYYLDFLEVRPTIENT